MATWLISANPNMYHHDAVFQRWGFIDWIQFANYDVGDIIYIYASKQAGYIKYKVEVTRNDMDYSEIQRDDEYWIDSHDLRKKDAKYSRMVLVGRLDDKYLNLDYLRAHGLKNAPQGAKRLSGELLSVIEREFEKRCNK